MEQPQTATAPLDAFLKRALIVALLVGAGLLFWMWRSVFLLLFASILIAIGLHGIADPIARRTPLNKAWALAVAALLLIGALFGLGWLFGSQVASQISDLSARLPAAWESLQRVLNGNPIGAQLLQRLESLATEDGMLPGISGAFTQVGDWSLSAASAALDGIIVLVAAAFFAINPKPYREGLLILWPDQLRREIDAALDNIRRALRKWLLGTLVSMSAMALMVGVGLWALGVPAFIPLALIAGLAQFVPLIGPIVAAVPGVLLALTIGLDTALWVLVVYTAASQIESALLYPLIQSRAVSLPPALTLFSIIAMGVLFGPLGIVFAVPLVVVIAILVVRLYVNRVLGRNVVPPGAG